MLPPSRVCTEYSTISGREAQPSNGGDGLSAARSESSGSRSSTSFEPGPKPIVTVVGSGAEAAAAGADAARPGSGGTAASLVTVIAPGPRSQVRKRPHYGSTVTTSVCA